MPKAKLTNGQARQLVSQRFCLASYGAITFLAQNFMENYFAVPIYNACLKSGSYNFWGAPPDYPMGYWVLLLAIPIWAALFWEDRILRRALPQPKALYHSIFVFSILFGAFLLTVFNYGLQHANLLFALGYSAVTAMSYGICTLQFDFSFVTDTSIAKEARLAHLSAKRDTYFRGLSMFLGICVALLVTGAMQFFLRDNSNVNSDAINMMHQVVIVNILVMAFGLALGLFYPLFQVILKIEEQFDLLKVPNQEE